jgi:hypothetical protein
LKVYNGEYGLLGLLYKNGSISTPHYTVPHSTRHKLSKQQISFILSSTGQGLNKDVDSDWNRDLIALVTTTTNYNPSKLFLQQLFIGTGSSLVFLWDQPDRFYSPNQMARLVRLQNSNEAAQT